MISTLLENPWRRLALALLVPAAIAGVSGCATREQSTDSFLGFITPYRIDIVQGNAVTKEQVERVRPGMTREQVQAVLGTPMLADPFHANRWDYFFSIRRPGTEVQKRVVVAHFKADVLERLEVPAQLPTEAEFVAAIVPVRKSDKPVVLELTEAQRQALPAPAPRKEAAAAEPAAPARTYPPLEPR